jgi:hypothetical protein
VRPTQTSHRPWSTDYDGWPDRRTTRFVSGACVPADLSCCPSRRARWSPTLSPTHERPTSNRWSCRPGSRYRQSAAETCDELATPEDFGSTSLALRTTCDLHGDLLVASDTDAAQARPSRRDVRRVRPEQRHRPTRLFRRSNGDPGSGSRPCVQRRSRRRSHPAAARYAVGSNRHCPVEPPTWRTGTTRESASGVDDPVRRTARTGRAGAPHRWVSVTDAAASPGGPGRRSATAARRS